MQPGMKYSYEFTVEDSMTARALGSGGVDVLSTPSMIAHMENACQQCVAAQLEPGQSTVGTVVNIRHMAATPVGMRVTVSCELIEIDRRRLVFRVESEDEREAIGAGLHERFIIDADRFEAKTNAKKQA